MNYTALIARLMDKAQNDNMIDQHFTEDGRLQMEAADAIEALKKALNETSIAYWVVSSRCEALQGKLINLEPYLQHSGDCMVNARAGECTCGLTRTSGKGTNTSSPSGQNLRP
jgi:hypothetical protein